MGSFRCLLRSRGTAAERALPKTWLNADSAPVPRRSYWQVSGATPVNRVRAGRYVAAACCCRRLPRNGAWPCCRSKHKGVNSLIKPGQRDRGPKRGKTATASIPLSQNRTKCPQSHRSGMIVGQKRRYTTRTTHNGKNSPAECRAKLDKSPQLARRCGPLTRMTHDQAPSGTGRRHPGSPGTKGSMHVAGHE
jgi:hypothetical protein